MIYKSLLKVQEFELFRYVHYALLRHHIFEFYHDLSEIKKIMEGYIFRKEESENGFKEKAVSPV